jgi:hypothetical protein
MDQSNLKEVKKLQEHGIVFDQVASSIKEEIQWTGYLPWPNIPLTLVGGSMIFF